MAPYRPNRKTKRSKKYKKLMSENTENTNNEAQPPVVNIGDLSAVLRIIDVVTERGSFKGPELSSVGALRDKIAAFVDFNTPEEVNDEETPADETTESVEATEETSE